jgi:hypothetical protein
MEKDKKSKIEIWLGEFFGDIGNLAVAMYCMGEFKPTIQKKAPEDEKKEEKSKPRLRTQQTDSVTEHMLRIRGEFL